MTFSRNFLACTTLLRCHGVHRHFHFMLQVFFNCLCRGKQCRRRFAFLKKYLKTFKTNDIDFLRFFGPDGKILGTALDGKDHSWAKGWENDEVASFLGQKGNF